MVLVHGFASSVERNWLRTGVIDALVQAGFRVAAYDKRGHGRSEKPHDPARYGEDDVHDIVRLLDHLEFPQAHLVGYPRGAMLAHHARQLYPDRLWTVTLSGYGSVGDQDPMLRQAERMADSVDELELRIIPGADHVGAPGTEGFSTHLIQFLSRHRRSMTNCCMAASSPACASMAAVPSASADPSMKMHIAFISGLLW